LSASWNAWEHFREAIHKTMVTEQELMDMLTTTPARLWELYNEDLVVAEKPADFFDINPENILMIVRDGKIVLYDETIAGKVDLNFSSIKINGREKFVIGDIGDLIKSIRSYKPDFEFTTTGISENYSSVR
jgi:hypothetical protein